MNARPLSAESQQPLRLQVGGTLNPRQHLYIKRPDDEILLELLSAKQYVNILTSRQMGKSSLMVRTAETLMQRGVHCAIVDLAAELGTPPDANAYFLGLLSKIARDLRIEVDLQAWWAEHPEETVNQRLMRFFRDVVLKQVPEPVVCFFDEIDSTLNPKLGWTDDLFTALRGMYNQRPLVPAYQRLTFCLIGVAWPNELIKDRRTTPYNVGRTLELGDFELGRDDLAPLTSALGKSPEHGRRLIERVLHWTGGHPYLTNRLCSSLVEVEADKPEEVDRHVDDAFQNLDRVSGDVHFQQVLRFLETRLADGLATFKLYEKILKGEPERDQPTLAHTELKLSGLVKRDRQGCLIVRNPIYAHLFDTGWLDNLKRESGSPVIKVTALILFMLATSSVVFGFGVYSESRFLLAYGIALFCYGIAVPIVRKKLYKLSQSITFPSFLITISTSIVLMILLLFLFGVSYLLVNTLSKIW
jgi:hypothetical protein